MTKLNIKLKDGVLKYVYDLKKTQDETVIFDKETKILTLNSFKLSSAYAFVYKNITISDYTRQNRSLVMKYKKLLNLKNEEMLTHEFGFSQITKQFQILVDYIMCVIKFFNFSFFDYYHF